MTDDSERIFAGLELEDCAGFLAYILLTDRKETHGELPGHRLDPTGPVELVASFRAQWFPDIARMPRVANCGPNLAAILVASVQTRGACLLEEAQVFLDDDPLVLMLAASRLSPEHFRWASLVTVLTVVITAGFAGVWVIAIAVCTQVLASIGLARVLRGSCHRDAKRASEPLAAWYEKYRRPLQIWLRPLIDLEDENSSLRRMTQDLMFRTGTPAAGLALAGWLWRSGRATELVASAAESPASAKTEIPLFPRKL